MSALVAPALALAALAFGLLFWMGALRNLAVIRKQVPLGEAALGKAEWTGRARLVGNAFHNQLELPPLFYALVLFLLVTQVWTSLDVTLAWIFVATRYAHAAVHVTTNDVRLRGPLFIAGALVLVGHWAWFGLRALG